MPVDLDTQLRALGDALTRASEPITIDELGAGDVTMRPSDASMVRAPARRRLVAAAAALASIATLGAIAAVGRDGNGDGRSVSTLPAADQQFVSGVLGLDPAWPLAEGWQAEAEPDSLEPRWGEIVTRRYLTDSPTPEVGPALDVATFLDGFVLPGILDDGPTIAVNGVQASWLDPEHTGGRGLAFLVDGRWFLVRGYRMTDDQIVTAARHTVVAPDGVGAVVDPAGRPEGVVEEFLSGGMSEMWLLPAGLTGDEPLIRWTDGERLVWLRGVSRDDRFVRSLRAVGSTVAETAVGGAAAFVATWDPQPNLRWMGWSDATTSYVLASNNLSSDELVEFASALRPLPTEKWLQLVDASVPDADELVPVGVHHFPLVPDALAAGGQNGGYGIVDGPGGVRAHPVVQLAPDQATVTVLPERFADLAAEWDGATSIVAAGRSAMVGETGSAWRIAVDLGDGETLVIDSNERSEEELIALAAAVELVDQATWEDRYEAIRPVASSATTSDTVPVTTVAEPVETLRSGDIGDRVMVVQEMLTQLRFDPGPADGEFGEMTRQAVWAFETLVMGIPLGQATGTVTEEVWERIGSELFITPRRPQEAGVDHVEIYLPEQVMVVFHDDEAALVTHISSGELDENGDPAGWCETTRVDTGPDGSPLTEPEDRAICGVSKTPGGIFDVDRLVPGTRVGPLGAMWNPIYFNYGIAIHGAKNVPLEPASHGNVRVPMHVADRLPELIDVGDTVYVWDGTKEPEDQTREDELPVFDWPDPSAA